MYEQTKRKTTPSLIDHSTQFNRWMQDKGISGWIGLDGMGLCCMRYKSTSIDV